MNAIITTSIYARDEIGVSVHAVDGKPYACVKIADELTIFVNDKEQAEKLAALLQEAAKNWEAKA